MYLSFVLFDKSILAFFQNLNFHPMKNYILYFLFGTLLFSFSACEEETTAENGTLDLQFQLVYDGEPLVMYDKYEYPDNQSIFFDRFNLFLSNGALVNKAEKSFAFDVLLLDFSDMQDVETATEGLHFKLTDLAPGEYEGLQIGVGLAPEWNATTPDDYTSTHPLANNYWSQWDSYIFAIFEGKADVSNNGTHDLALTYHIGKDESFEQRILDLPINIRAGKTTELKVTIDLLNVFQNSQRHLDIQELPFDHSTKPEVYGFLMKNLADALQIENL